MDVQTVLGLAYFVRVFVAWFVYYNRSDLARVKAEYAIDRREFFLQISGGS